MSKRVLSFVIAVIVFASQISGVFAAVGDTGTYNGFNYTVTGETTATITKYTGSDVEVTVPEKINGYTVTKIGNTAFQDKKTIEKITLPDTITSIDDYNVFWYCTSLKSINLPSSLTYLATGAFSGCSSLEEIVIPDGITKLSKTFRGCTSLKKIYIPDSVESMDIACFYNSALSGTTVMKGMTIYCNEGSYAQKFALDNGINCVAKEPAPDLSVAAPFVIENREVTIVNNKPQINISLNNVSYDGECTAYAALYKRVYSDEDVVLELYAIDSVPVDIEKGKTENLPIFSFNKNYTEDLTYKIIIVADDMTPLLDTVERALVDKDAEAENYPKMNLFESNSSSSSWDKSLTNTFSVSGWANLTMNDNLNYLPYEAYRSFPEIVDNKVTLDFDFSMNAYMDDTRFSVLDGEEIIVGFITQGTHLYLEQPNGESIELAEYAPYSSSDEDSKCYVRAEFDLETGMINYVRVNGDVVVNDVPLTGDSNRIDGFDILTGVEAEGRLINRQVRINCDYIVNEDFANQFGTLPKDWTYEMNGSETSVYKTNSRVPDRFSINVDTTNGEYKAVKSFDMVTGNPVFEVMTLQPEKRDGLKFSLKNGDKSVLEILADGEDFVLNTGKYNNKFYKYQANVWYGIKAEIDLINSKADIFVNNKEILSDVAIDTKDFQIDNIEILASKNSKNFVYDDVKLYHNRIIPDDYVPQPVKPEKTDNYVMGMQVCNLWTEGQYNKSWDYVKSAEDRLPIFGPYDEGNPEMNDWEIKWMLEHGIDYELIWAYPNVKYSTSEDASPIKPNMVREGHYVYDGFMNAEYSDMMKFAVSFENDTITSGEAFCDEFFENYAPYLIEYYFKDDRYLKIDNRPIFGVYVMDKFLGMFGTMGEDDAAINQGIARFRQMCIDAGVGNPYIISHGFGYTESTFQKYSAYDIDCIGLASWPKHEGLTWQKSDIKNMAKMGDKYGIDFVASIQPRLDLAAWEQRTGFHASGEEFTDVLEWTRDELPALITNNSLSKNLMTFLTWNEYGEGHIMMPTKQDGFTYLDAVRSTFIGDDEHTDVIPEGVQVDRINRMVDNDRMVTTVRENAIPLVPENLSDFTVKKGWYFTSQEDYTDWSAESAATISNINGNLVVDTTDNEPVITLTDVPEIDLYDVTYVKVRMKGNTTSCGGNIKWTTDVDGTFDDIKRTYMETPVSMATTMNDYYIPIGQSVKRTGKLTGLKFTPGLILDKTQDFEIESIELLSDNRISNGTKLVYGTKITPTENEPVYKNGTLMIPLRDVINSMDATIGWYAHNNSYVIYDGLALVMTFGVGDTVAMRGNIPFSLSQAPYAVSDKINDTVYVPVELIENGLKVKVDWNSQNKTLTIYNDQKTVNMPDGCEIVKVDYMNDRNYTYSRLGLTSAKRTAKGKDVKTGTSPSYNGHILYKTYFAGIDTADVDYVSIKLFSSIDSSMKFYFTLDDETTINLNTPVKTVAVKRGINNILIPTSELEGWQNGELNYLRIDPLTADGEFELDYVALLKK